jgi:hypothetical protein
MGPKQIEDIDDDKLVDAIAAYGLKGIHLYGNSADKFFAVFGFSPWQHVKPVNTQSVAADFRWYAIGEFKEWPTLIGRLTYDGDPAYLQLSNKEWAKRLAGKTAEEIEKLLDGTNQ